MSMERDIVKESGFRKWGAFMSQILEGDGDGEQYEDMTTREGNKVYIQD